MAVDVEQPDQEQSGTTESPPVKKRRSRKRTDRKTELSGRPEIAEKLTKLFQSVEKGFADQRDRADRIMDYWDAYNCELSRYQNYTGGMSNLFVPIIRNAVNALVTRYVNQAFPTSGRHVEAITGEEEQPFALLSLIEHYIDKDKLRTQAAPALLVNGQIEGQYNAYVDWDKLDRFVVSRETEPMSHMGLPMPELGEIETVAEEKVSEDGPGLDVLHDSDVLVLPQTANSIDRALEIGGSVSVVRRWSKELIQQKIDDEEITKDRGELLLEHMGTVENNPDTAKKLAHDAGIHISGKSAGAVVYETWTKTLKIDGKRRLFRAYWAGEDGVLGCKLNPYWNDRCPVLSGPVEKVPGVFKGESPVKSSMDMQYWANDMANEAAHEMFFALAPIVTVDPEKVTKWKELVSDVAAVWPVPGESVKLLEWPNKAREAMEIIQFCKAGIFENLEVSPGMLPQQTGRPGSKRNQAEIALEQQVEILQTAGAVVNFEGEILTPAVQRFAEYDHQFREKDILVRQFGELGLEAEMQVVEPTQFGRRWRLQWAGVESARNAANVQQQNALLANVMKIPPQMYMGFRLNLTRAIENAMAQVFPARLARQVFKSMKDELSVDPQVENQMLDQGMEVHTHAADPDPQHLQIHMQGLQKDRKSTRLN